MNFLHPLFEAVSQVPVADPEYGYEAKLLICGAKPWLCYCEVKADGPARKRSGHDRRVTDANLALVEAAVRAGQLEKHTVELQNDPARGRTILAHYYYWPRYRDDVLQQVAAEQSANRLRQAALTDDQRELKAQYESFQRLPVAVRWLATAAAPAARYCRYQVRKRDAKLPPPLP